MALPAFHLVAERFPDSERRVLTNCPVSSKAPPVSSVLTGTGLVHGFFHYPLGTRDPRELWKLRAELGNWKPDLLVYLAEARGLMQTLRDLVFFRCCGVRSQRRPKRRACSDLFVHEAERLIDRIRELGSIDLSDQQYWDLKLTDQEASVGREATAWLTPRSLVACSVGTKVQTKFWGEQNWKRLLDELAFRYPQSGLMLLGSREERELSDRVSDAWKGRAVNLCGVLSPRESAAAAKCATIVIGHDSGPMHLAASVGTPCVAIFSARELPGVWYPYGVRHQVIYHHTECFGCRLDECIENQMKCIRSISVEEVVQKVETVLQANPLLA
jgi:hypothetical protein